MADMRLAHGGWLGACNACAMLQRSSRSASLRVQVRRAGKSCAIGFAISLQTPSWCSQLLNGHSTPRVWGWHVEGLFLAKSTIYISAQPLTHGATPTHGAGSPLSHWGRVEGVCKGSVGEVDGKLGEFVEDCA
jgi:hypothetical protein